MTTGLLLAESPFHPNLSQMRFAVFDSPELIRGRCPVAFSFPTPSVRCRFRRQLWLPLSESPFMPNPLQMRFAVFDSAALIRSRCRVAFSFPTPPCVGDSEDYCGCHCWNRLYGFIFRKCGLPFSIQRHSFGLRIPAASLSISLIGNIAISNGLPRLQSAQSPSAFVFANTLCCF